MLSLVAAFVSVETDSSTRVTALDQTSNNSSDHPPTTERASVPRALWATGVIVLAVAGVLAYRGLYRTGESISPDVAKRLIGRWVRPDGGYVLEIDDVRSGYALTARYFNPQPVNVSHAKWTRDGDALGVFVEFEAPNYTGSTYTLTHDPATDRLVGVYYQATQQQHYDIEFRRVP